MQQFTQNVHDKEKLLHRFGTSLPWCIRSWSYSFK